MSPQPASTSAVEPGDTAPGQDKSALLREDSPWDDWWEMVRGDDGVGYPKRRRVMEADDDACIAFWEREGIAMTEIARAWGTTVCHVRKVRDLFSGKPIPDW